MSTIENLKAKVRALDEAHRVLNPYTGEFEAILISIELEMLDIENRIAHLETEHAQSISDDGGFKGYYYTDKDGNSAHTWDFEESIGE